MKRSGNSNKRGDITVKTREHAIQTLQHRRGSQQNGGGAIGAYVSLYKEVVPPLLISGVLSLIPGVFLTAFTSTFKEVPGLLMLVPALIGMRGNIFGSLCARLSTELQVTKQTKRAFAQKVAFFDSFAMFEALLLSFCLPVLCKVSEPLLPHLLSSASTVTFICMLSGWFSASIMLFCTKYVIRKSLSLGLNPDNVGPPFITTVGDIITMPIVVSVTALCMTVDDGLRWAAVVALLIYMCWNVRVGWTFTSPKKFSATARERIPTLLSCMAISFVAGIALEGLLQRLGDDVRIQVYLALVPLINAQGGSGGSVIASRTTTRHFALDPNAPKKRANVSSQIEDEVDIGESLEVIEMTNTNAIGEALVLTIAICTVLLTIALGVYVVSPSLNDLVELLTTMVMMSALLGGASAAIAVITIRVAVYLGLHPDNIAVPIVCAMMDVVASWGFTLVLITFLKDAQQDLPDVLMQA